MSVEHEVNSIQGMRRRRDAEAELAATDYRVIKAMEAIAAAKIEEMYPGAVQEREALRVQIRELRGE